MHQQLTNK